jgi:high-affinity Fe2+/Pb2+ permease
MTNAGTNRSLWFLALLSGLALGIIAVLVQFSPLNLLMIGVGLTVMVAALVGLRRPKRVRIPYKKTFS